MRSQTWAGLGVAVALLGAGAGWVVLRQQAEREAVIQGLVRTAEIEWERDKINRNDIVPLLRKLQQHEDADADARLIDARARLLLVLGRLDDAWAVYRPLALSPDVTPDDLLVAARIRARQHGMRGVESEGNEALSFASRHHDGTGALASAFLAWQCARRIGRVDEAERFAEVLGSRFGDSPEAKLVAYLRGDPAPSVNDLRELEVAFSTIPVELHFAIAVMLLETDGVAAGDEVVSRVESILAAYPSSVDGRHLAAAGYHATEDMDRRNAHLDWLLANAPDDDQRRKLWEQMRGPVAGRGQ